MCGCQNGGKTKGVVRENFVCRPSLPKTHTPKTLARRIPVDRKAPSALPFVLQPRGAAFLFPKSKKLMLPLPLPPRPAATRTAGAAARIHFSLSSSAPSLS